MATMTMPTPSLLLLLLVVVAAPRCCHGSSLSSCHQQQHNATNASSSQQKVLGRRAAVTALIAFGASIVDPGNNNGLHTTIKANHPPYGKDFFNHVATGRFSNGLLPTDLIAQELGLKQQLPAYLGVKLSPEDLLTGISFASAASGFDPLTPVLVSVISLDQQLAYFDEYRGKLVEIAGEEETARIIGGALFLVSAGNDDLANTYFTTPFRSAEYDIPSYVELLVSHAEDFLRKVSSRGTRKVGFMGLLPLGCLPGQRTLGGGLARACEPKRNEAARLYNTRVQEMIAALNAEPGFMTRVVFLDIYRVLDDLVRYPERYGFSETSRGCCGTGTIEVAALCDSHFVSVCDDVSQHVFFDSAHPTERAYRIIVKYIFANYGQQL